MPVQIEEASELFLIHCRSALTLSAHTILAYNADLLDFRRGKCFNKRIDEIQKNDVREYLRGMREQRRLKETTIKRRLATLKVFFRWLVSEGLLDADPLATLNEKIRLPKRLPRALDTADRTMLRKETQKTPTRSIDFDALRRTTAIQLLLETGVRVGELVAIDLNDVSIPDGRIVIHGKGNRQRLAYIYSPTLMSRLTCYVNRRRNCKAACTRLLVSPNGQPLSTAAIRRDLQDVCTSAGIVRRVTPHMLRHTCATEWLERGLDIRYVQRLLGHHSISTTETYTHVSDKGLRDALIRAGGLR